MLHARRARLTYGLICGLFPGVMAVGCTVKSGNPKTVATSGAGQQKSGSSGKSKKKHEPKVTTENGKKYLDGIPYDVWFDDPLTEVANTNTVASTTPAPANGETTPRTTAPQETKPEVTKPAPAAGGDWATYIGSDQVLEESKRVRNKLKTLLQTQATYNSDFEVIKMEGAVISALAGITIQGGDGINWKPNAPYIRDYGLEIVESAKGLGKPNYDKTNAAYENLQSVFSGSIPAGAAEPAASRPFGEVSSRFYLMKRMKNAFDLMKLNINTEAKLKSDQEQTLHEAMILTALSKVITSEGYSSADEAEYVQFAKEMIDASLNAAQSVKDQEFMKFQDAINKIEKTCNDCHAQYRNG